MSARALPTTQAVESLDFSTLLRAGDGVVIGQMAGEPLALCERLFGTASIPAGVSAFIGASITGSPLAAKGSGMGLSSYGGLFRTAEIGRTIPVNIYPMHYHRLGAAMTSGAIASDVVLMQAVRDEQSGRLYAGAGRNYMFEAARRARLVIVEINPNAPVIPGGEIPDDVPIHHAIRRRADPGRSYPWALDAGLTIPFLLDTLGNAVGLYDSVDVTDDVLHAVNWWFLMAGITTSIGWSACRRAAGTPRWLVWLAGTGVGALAIIGWEIAEYGVMKAGVGNLSLTYGDTLFDLALSSCGGALGAWVVVSVAGRSSERSNP